MKARLQWQCMTPKRLEHNTVVGLWKILEIAKKRNREAMKWVLKYSFAAVCTN